MTKVTTERPRCPQGPRCTRSRLETQSRSKTGQGTPRPTVDRATLCCSNCALCPRGLWCPLCVHHSRLEKPVTQTRSHTSRRFSQTPQNCSGVTSDETPRQTPACPVPESPPAPCPSSSGSDSTLLPLLAELPPETCHCCLWGNPRVFSCPYLSTGFICCRAATTAPPTASVDPTVISRLLSAPQRVPLCFS